MHKHSPLDPLRILLSASGLSFLITHFQLSSPSPTLSYYLKIGFPIAITRLIRLAGKIRSTKDWVLRPKAKQTQAIH